MIYTTLNVRGMIAETYFAVAQTIIRAIVVLSAKMMERLAMYLNGLR
jgi:hypothetical protein